MVYRFNKQLLYNYFKSILIKIQIVYVYNHRLNYFLLRTENVSQLLQVGFGWQAAILSHNRLDLLASLFTKTLPTGILRSIGHNLPMSIGFLSDKALDYSPNIGVRSHL